MKKNNIILSLLLTGLLILNGCDGDDIDPRSAPIVDPNEAVAGMSVSKIWDNGTHSAFTSIIKYGDQYYISFREGETHIFNSRGEADGKVRIISSTDGEEWNSVALLSVSGLDLRDPKLSITPDGRLMVIMAGAKYVNKVLESRTPMVSFSSNGTDFSTPSNATLNAESSTGTDWIWRVTWHGDTGYGICYSLNESGASTIFLVKTTDGVNYSQVTKLDVGGAPNESTVQFLPDGRMVAIVRRDGSDCNGFWGISEEPYTSWTWSTVSFRIGGPDLLVLDESSTIILGARSYDNNEYKTALYSGSYSGSFVKTLVLQSSGDTGYPGLLKVGEELWVSYYSSGGFASTKAAIYLAKVPISAFN